MAKKGNNNKNKVRLKGVHQTGGELNDEGKVKYTDAFLSTARKKSSEELNQTTERHAELSAQIEKHVNEITRWRSEELQIVHDLTSIQKSIHTTMQNQTNTAEQMYGVQNKLADKLQLAATYQLEIETAQREGNITNEKQLAIQQRTLRNLQDLGRLKTDAITQAQKLANFTKQSVPYYDKVQKFEAEIKELTKQVGDNVSGEKHHRLQTLNSMVKEYAVLGKLEKRNARKAKIQKSVKDLMTMQGTAAGKILKTLSDIVTNPLLIFTGLLALGAQRFDQMRQRGNELAEELDRVNKKLAGSGPYQDAIIKRARTIHSVFRAAGEGFAGSLESAVDAVQALQKQLGNMGSVSKDLVNLMSTIKLSINLSDDEVAKVIDTYMIVGQNSESAAKNAANMLYSMSETAGLNPGEMVKEIASATGETLAHFKGGTSELNNAVIAAKKMGLSLEDVAKVSRGLLDFETSIEAEMEAMMLTGMNLNFNKARHFAMNKQGAKATQEVLRQVGGLERFQKFNIFQQEAVARATGLNVDELLKTNVQREREKQIAKEKQEIHKDTAKMLPLVTNVMGKLETGLGIIDKLAAILGDIVLDVFGVDFKRAEELILAFVNSDTFQTGLKNVLFFMKGVIEGIVDVVSTIWTFLKDMPVIGPILKRIGKQDMSGGYEGAQKAGNVVGKVLTAGYITKKILGLTPLTAMWVQSSGGAMKGLGGEIAKGIKGLLGYGGQAAPTGAMGGVTTAGYLAAGAVIAKGVWDVGTLTGRSTSGETAEAVGGLVGAIAGAKGGAMIGTMIAPGVGTAIGAAVGAAGGYVGGRLVKHIEFFQDDLDKARIKIADAEIRAQEEVNGQNNIAKLKMVEESNKVRASFTKFGLGTDGMTKKEIAGFAKAQLEAGNITKKEYTSAIQGSMSGIDLLSRAVGGARGQIANQEHQRQMYVQGQMTVEDIEIAKRLAKSKTQLKVVESVTPEMIDESITLKQIKEDDRGFAYKNPFLFEHDRAIVVQQYYELYGKVIPKDQIEKALKDASQGMSIYFTNEGEMEMALKKVRGAMLEDLETAITEDEVIVLQTLTKRMQNARKLKFDKDNRLIVEEKKPLLEVRKKIPLKMERGGITKFAQGGITGKKFARGGITGEKFAQDRQVFYIAKEKYIQEKRMFNIASEKFDLGGLTRKFANGTVTTDPPPSGYIPRDDYVLPSETTQRGGNIQLQFDQAVMSDELSAKQRPWFDKVNKVGGLKPPYNIGGEKGKELSEAVGKKGEIMFFDYGDDVGRHSPIAKQHPGGEYWNKKKGTPNLTYEDVGLISMMQAASKIPAGGGLWGGSLGRNAWNQTDIPFDEGKGGDAWKPLKKLYSIAYHDGLGSGKLGHWKKRGNIRERFEGSLEGTKIANLRRVMGINKYNDKGDRLSNKEIHERVKALANATGGRELAAGILMALAAPAAIGAWTGIATGTATATAGMTAGTSILGAAWPVVSGLAQAGLGIETILSLGDVILDVYNGDVGKGGTLNYLSKALPKPLNYIPKSVQGYNDLQEKPPNILNFITHLLPWDKTDGAHNILKGGLKSWKSWHKPSYEIANSMLGDGFEASFGRYLHGRGGITPVNDMILSADGQLIETHEDDNIIARKGKVIQDKSGASVIDYGVVNSLLRELLIVSDSTTVEIDGKVVSEAV